MTKPRSTINVQLTIPLGYQFPIVGTGYDPTKELWLLFETTAARSWSPAGNNSGHLEGEYTLFESGDVRISSWYAGGRQPLAVTTSTVV